jgi:hypothetical protein
MVGLVGLVSLVGRVSIASAWLAAFQATPAVQQTPDRPADPQKSTITAPPAVPDPSYAKLMTPADFTAAELPVRRRVMSAWAIGSAETAGAQLLPLLAAGLADSDREVRSQALRVLDKVELHAFSNRLANKPVVTDPSTNPEIYDALVRMIEDPEPSARAAAVAGLSNLDPPPQDRLEKPLLTLLAKESVPAVRERIVVALTTRAAGGSTEALTAIMGAMDDVSLEVRFRALTAMQRPEVLPRVLRELSSDVPGMRLAAVRVLAAFGNDLAPHRSALQERMTIETNAQVKSELERLLLLIGTNPPTPPKP